MGIRTKRKKDRSTPLKKFKKCFLLKKKLADMIYIFFNTQSYSLFVKKKCKNFCPLFK